MNNQLIIILTTPANRYIYYYNQFITDVNNRLLKLWHFAWNDAGDNTHYQNIISDTMRFDRLCSFFSIIYKDGYIDLYLPYDETQSIHSSPFYPANPNGINILMNDALFNFFVGFSEQFLLEVYKEIQILRINYN